MALILHLVEAFLPPLPIPGVRLGLANIVTLAVLEIRTSSAFTLSSCGCFWVLFSQPLSAPLPLAEPLRRFGKLSSDEFPFEVFAAALRLLGLSVAGALSHNLAQLLKFTASSLTSEGLFII